MYRPDLMMQSRLIRYCNELGYFPEKPIDRLRWEDAQEIIRTYKEVLQ